MEKKLIELGYRYHEGYKKWYNINNPGKWYELTDLIYLI